MAKKVTKIDLNAVRPVEAISDVVGEFPIIRCIAVHKASELHDSYVTLVIEIQGDKILSVTSTEPNLKAIAIDECKVVFVTNFIQRDF